MSFIIATIVTAIGSAMAIPAPQPESFTILPTPLLMILIGQLLLNLGMISLPPPDHLMLFMHPVEFAGWVGLVITMLNLLPAAMLDGGHVARSLVGEKARIALTVFSILLLILSDFWLMAMFVLFMAMQRHPGPLDDVSSLSTNRKLLAVTLIAIFVLSFPLF